MKCLKCLSTHVQKNGVLPSGGQRYKCKECFSHFTLWGLRGTYTDTFRQKIIELYCHSNHAVRRIAKNFELSTSTIIQRSKDHKKICKKCK